MASVRGSAWLGLVVGTVVGPLVGAVVGMVVGAGAGDAAAQPRPAVPPLVGAAELLHVTSPAGFIDDAVASDGGRLAYVVADAASKAELHVVTLATQVEQVIDLSPVTLAPIALELIGARVFVIGRLEDGKQIGALVELADQGKGKPPGTVVYKIAPATHITVLPRGVAVHRAAPSKTGTRHDLELVAIDSGRRLAAARPLELDAAGASPSLDFRVNHWSAGWTRAHGIKGGEWDRKENQRAPDREGTYDLLAGKLVEPQPIADLFEQRRRFQALAADAGGRVDFIRAGADGKLERWRSGKPGALELDQPFAVYDPRSLQGAVLPDGSAWIILKVDPVHPDAVARKKADPEYLDVFQAPPDGKAVRRARVLATGVRHRAGVLGDRLWLLERNQGFDRGGKRLTVYQLQ